MFSPANKTQKTAPVVQPKAAGTTFFRKAGEESFFGAKENPTFFNKPIQAKLTVSTPDDPHEKEADAVAEKVMRMLEPVAASPLRDKKEEKLQRKEEKEQQEEIHPKLEAPNVRIQCKQEPWQKLQAKACNCSSSDDHTHLHAKSNTAISTQHSDSSISLYSSDIIQQSGRGPPATSIPFEQTLASSKGGGSALPGKTQQFMESRFNADFSGVRVHTDPTAVSLTSNVNAQAFAHGNDIYFNSGKYSPDTTGGRTLLAHELTHTIQQGASKNGPLSNNVSTSVARKNITPRSAEGKIRSLSSIAKKSSEQINALPKRELSHLSVDINGNIHQSHDTINRTVTVNELKKKEKHQEENELFLDGIQKKEKIIQLKPSDYRHQEDGAAVKQRMKERIDQAPKKEDSPNNTDQANTTAGGATAPRNNRTAHPIDRGELRKQKNALQGQARPDVNRPAQEHSKVAQTANNLKQAVNKPATKKGETPKGKSGSKQALSAAERAANVAKQAFSSAKAIPHIPQPSPSIPPPAVPQPIDSAGTPLPPNPAAETQVAEMNQQVNALRMGGHHVRMLARQEHQNAMVMRGNIQMVEGQLQQAEQGISHSNDHLAFRHDLMTKANQSLAVSEQKATVVATESPNVVAKANEGKEESGPMSSEATQLSSENASNTPDDEEGAANAREQGGKINQAGSDIATTDGAIAQTRTKAESLGAEAAHAAQLNTQTRGQINNMNQTLTQTSQKLSQMTGQTNQAKGQINALNNQPSRLMQQAQQLDQQGISLIKASEDIERSLHRTQQNYRSGMQAIPKLRMLPEPKDGEDGIIQRQAAAPSAGIDWLGSNEGRYEDRRNLDLTGRLSGAAPTWLTGAPDPASEEERERARIAEEDRRSAQIAEINQRAGGNFANLSTADKAGIALRLTGRNLFGSVSNIKWSGWGHLAAGLIDPRGPMMGVVGGLSMMLSGGANLLSGEQWARDPLGNLLKSAADIATGLTIILGSITALAGVIIAIMTAITILSFGFAAPVTGPIISFCASVMVTVGGWTIAVGKVALILQALVFIKNLIDAATAKTAEQLQNNADQMTQDASNAGNVLLQIGMAKLAQIGGRQLQGEIAAAEGGAVGFARGMPGRLAASGRAAPARIAAGVRAIPGAIASGARAVGRGISGGVRAVGGALKRGYNWVRNRLGGAAGETAAGEAGAGGRLASGEAAEGTALSEGAPRPPRTTELAPEDVSDLVSRRSDGSFRLNRKRFGSTQKIVGEPEAVVAEHAAREAYAAQRAANMPNVERVYMGHEADRLINPDVPLGSELSADVVGVTRQGRYVLIESKGTDILHGLDQLEHSAQALGRENIVRYELVVAEEIRTPGFSIKNGRLQLRGEPYIINGKPVFVRRTTT